MKTSKFSDSQILAILKQAEAGTPVPGLCREHGGSWRKKAVQDKAIPITLACDITFYVT